MITADSSMEIAREPRSFPMGEAEKMNQLIKANWREHSVLFSEVDNEVIDVNPNFKTPLKLMKGEKSSLGVLVRHTLAEMAIRPNKLEPTQHIFEYWDGHSRSFILKRIGFTDVNGIFYRDMDIKGAGNVQRAPYEPKTGIITFMTGEPYLRENQRTGLIDKETALYDYEMSEKIHSLGVRTYRILALIELKDERLRRRLYNVPDFTPVIEVRAFGTKLRINDAVNATKGEELMLEDAKKLVAQELGKETLSDQEYFDWFIITLAKNVGLMHRNGLMHGGLWEHNITLDCRLVDVDSAGMTKKSQRKKDTVSAERSLFSLGDALFNYDMHPADIDKSKEMAYIRQKFRETYNAVSSSKKTA